MMLHHDDSYTHSCLDTVWTSSGKPSWELDLHKRNYYFNKDEEYAYAYADTEAYAYAYAYLRAYAYA